MSSRRWKDEDASSYDEEVAHIYNHWVERLGNPLAEHLCRIGRLTLGQHVLDVGCGSGVGTRIAARHVGPRGSVIGVDLSAGMLEAARSNESNQPNITYIRMDAENMDFATDTFDNVLSLCAVAHFPGIGDALREMTRVLKPGGRLVVSYGYARPIKAIDLAFHLAERLVQRLNRFRPTLQAPGFLEAVVSEYTTAPVQDMLASWTRDEPHQHLMKGMRDAGLQGVDRSWCGHVLPFSSAEDFLEAQLAISTKVRKQLKTMPPEQVAAIKSAYAGKVQAVLERGGHLIYPYGAQFVGGTKPGKPQAPAKASLRGSSISAPDS